MTTPYFFSSSTSIPLQPLPSFSCGAGSTMAMSTWPNWLETVMGMSGVVGRTSVVGWVVLDAVVVVVVVNVVVVRGKGWCGGRRCSSTLVS